MTSSEFEWPRWRDQSPEPDGAGDQPVGGGGVGNAQQRLGEAEQQHPLLARQPIFVQEGIDAAALARGLPAPP